MSLDIKEQSISKPQQLFRSPRGSSSQIHIIKNGVLLPLICLAWFVSAHLGQPFTELCLHFLLYLPSSRYQTLLTDLGSLLLCWAGCARANRKGKFQSKGKMVLVEPNSKCLKKKERTWFPCVSEAFLTMGCHSFLRCKTRSKRH